MAAISTLNTLSKIVDALEDRPDDLMKISILLERVFNYGLSQAGSDYFEETIHIMTCLLYYSPENSL